MENIVTPKTRLIKISSGEDEGKEVEVPASMGHLNLSSNDFPEIKRWETGEEYVLKIKVRQTGSREADEWEIQEGRAIVGDVNVNFDIIGAETVKNNNKKDEEYED